MENYIVKMQREKEDLTGKMKKLSAALENRSLHLKDCQRDLMIRQLKAMSDYLDALTERIAYEKAN